MNPEENYVEAIEDGKIVKVSKIYALQEGLIILKKPEISRPSTTPVQNNQIQSNPREDYRKTFSAIKDRKIGWQEQQVLNELVENFQWKIRTGRRKKNYTRRQLASKISESDEKLQILESGRLPSNDFVLINKVQEALGINLRKDGKDFITSPQEIMERALPRTPRRLKSDDGKVSRDFEIIDSGIEILEDEI